MEIIMNNVYVITQKSLGVVWAKPGIQMLGDGTFLLGLGIKITN